MSVSRPARCLLSTPSMPIVRPRTRCQNFHSSPKLSIRRKPRFVSIKAAEMGLVSNRTPATAIYKQFDDKDKIELKRRYTPEQIEAIEAGERAIDPEDLKTQGIIRTDLGALPYLDDLSQNAQWIDKKIESNQPRPRKERMMTQDEWGRYMASHLMDTGSHVTATQARNRAFEDFWIRDQKPCFQCGEKGHDDVVCHNKALPEPKREALEQEWENEGRFEAMRNFNTEDPAYKAAKEKLDEQNDADILRAFQGFTGWIGNNGPIIDDPSSSVGSASALAPPLPRRIDPNALATLEAAKKEQDPRDEEGVYDKLRAQTGMTLDEILDLKTKTLVVNYVANQTRLGKIQSVYMLSIAGNGNGRLGIGEAKGQEPEETRMNSRMAAIRNMRPIPRYEERTIFGEVDGKVAATEVKLVTRPPGFGLRCQHLIFEMCRAAGIHDLAARVPRSRNKMNTVKAAYQALMSQRIPDEIARGRGKKLVDVRRVYYAGRV